MKEADLNNDAKINLKSFLTSVNNYTLLPNFMKNIKFAAMNYYELKNNNLL